MGLHLRHAEPSGHGRLAAADAPAPYTNNYGCWTYDAIGNRTAESMSGTNCSSNPPLASFASYAPGSNQFASTSQSLGGVPYDASGNVLADDSHWYLYDGEGRLCAVASVPMPGITAMTGYLYDAAGRRVAKGTIASWSCDPAVNGFQSTNDYILGQSGEQITEMGMNAAGMAWQHTNVYAAGTLLATYDAGDLHFYLNDPLGTRRAQTDHAGVPEQTCSGLPLAMAPSAPAATSKLPPNTTSPAKNEIPNPAMTTSGPGTIATPWGV